MTTNPRHHHVRISKVVVVLSLELEVNAVLAQDIALGALQLHFNSRRPHRAFTTALPNRYIDAFIIHSRVTEFEACGCSNYMQVREAELFFLLVDVHC